MKVTFDISGLSGNAITGVGVYTTNLVRNLLKFNEIEVTGRYKISRFKSRKAIIEKLPIKIEFPYIPIIDSILPKSYDVFHGPDFWLPSGGRYKKVVTIHDLAIYHEGLYSEERRKYSIPIFENMLFKAKPDHVIVVSDFIKNEFLGRFPAFKGRVSVVYHGSEHFDSDLNFEPVYDFPYIVYIGTIEARKNVRKLIDAFAFSNHKNPDLRLVLIGGSNGYQGSEILNEIKIHPLSSKIITPGFVDSYQAKCIIANAVALVYPSLYEGFGFPILEGMKLGVPVITSSFGAMAEIGGDAAICVDTTDAELLSFAMNELVENSSKRTNLIQKGKVYATNFSWNKCATQTLSIYKDLV